MIQHYCNKDKFCLFQKVLENVPHAAIKIQNLCKYKNPGKKS